EEDNRIDSLREHSRLSGYPQTAEPPLGEEAFAQALRVGIDQHLVRDDEGELVARLQRGQAEMKKVEIEIGCAAQRIRVVLLQATLDRGRQPLRLDIRRVTGDNDPLVVS